MAVSFEQNQLNQNQNQDQQNTGGGTALSGSGGQVSQPQGRVANYSTGNQPTQGSGRFTNLKNYINANQGSGDRLAQGINKNVNKQTEPQKTEANTQASAVREGIQSANNQLQTGKGYQQQLNDTNFNAQDFANNQQQLEDFGKYRTNTAIDGQGLQTNVNNAQTTAANYANSLQNLGNQAATESGRFSMLKNAFAGQNPYSTGQQRLDQLFLQSGGNNGVQQLQNNIRNQQNEANRLNTTLTDYANQITGDNGITSQAKSLADALQNKTNELETGYINNLEGQVAGVNQNRADTRNRYNEFFNTLTGANQNALDTNLLNESGLKQGQQTFNVLKDPNLQASNVINFDQTDASNYRDIANQENVDYYGALAKLAGMNNDKLNTTGQLVDPTTGQLKSAASFVTGENSLTGRVDAARDKILNDATKFYGDNAANYNLGTTGGRVGSTTDSSVADYLKNLTGNQSYYGSLQRDIYGNDTTNSTNAINNVLRQSGADAQGNVNGNNINQAAANVVNQVGNTAQNNLKNQMLDYLANQGFFNYLGGNGVQEGARDIAAYGYGGANKDNPTGMYTAPNDVSKF